ncbi:MULTISPECIES: hypothetical protein [unclassified Clostridioides]|uniref:hypothetical protein n=1 Tax=unclassified Clostridioides TaxID=2635829 RepID=UPI0016BC8CD1|nr:hypothetical protein [Clostridioides sp. ZZV14-6387]MDI7817603.1 hypothetical protein [Clostridioides difficile]NJI82558.1 hypothetical protein [Clostridioides difficile]
MLELMNLMKNSMLEELKKTNNKFKCVDEDLLYDKVQNLDYLQIFEVHDCMIKLISMKETNEQLKKLKLENFLDSLNFKGDNFES